MFRINETETVKERDRVQIYYLFVSLLLLVFQYNWLTVENKCVHVMCHNILCVCEIYYKYKTDCIYLHLNKTTFSYSYKQLFVVYIYNICCVVL